MPDSTDPLAALAEHRALPRVSRGDLLCGYSVQVLGSFAVSVAIGLALGFLFGVGCAAAVLYTVFLSGYRAALRESAAGGNTARYQEQSRKLRGR